MRPTLLFLLVLAAPLYAQPAAPRGVVVCVSPPAAAVGADILRRGGSAVDAAVAVGFAQAVTWPEAGNIGGGGFMLVWPGGGKEPIVFDYREKAPWAARPDMFAADANPLTLKAAGVPGTVRGLALAHQRFGKLPWKDLVAAAAKLAADGFPVTGPLADSLNKVLADPETTNAEFRRVFGRPGGGPWRAGDRLTQPDLAGTLRAIADRGADGFYAGDLAAKLSAEMRAGGGLITPDDLGRYVAKERRPVRGTYRGYGVVGVPPPSGGGTLLVEMLDILECFDLAKHPRHSPEATHLLAEAMRRAYRDRAEFLGDPDFSPVPPHLLDKAYARTLAAGIDPLKATPSASLAGNIPLADGGGQTTHFAAVDRNGMCVSNTYTLENAWGCRVVVRGAGYVLNNQMTDFNHKPGVTDRSGRVGTPPNLAEPYKRPLSSMCPAILLKDGKPVLVTGSPGGRTIPNTVLGIVVNVVDYRMTPRAAVDAPRSHHQWFPDRLDHEEFPGLPALSARLTAMGHAVRKHRQGDAHTLALDPATGAWVGVADTRVEGAVGVE